MSACGQPSSSSLRLTGGFCHADWTVPRQDVNSPFLPCACHSETQRCLHACRFGIACLGDNIHLATIFGLVAEAATVSLRTLAFFFPLVTDTFSSFNANDSLSTLDHGSRFNSPVSGVKVSFSECLIFSSLHHGFQLLIVRNRCLLMNLHVVQFQSVS